MGGVHPQAAACARRHASCLGALCQAQCGAAFTACMACQALSALRAGNEERRHLSRLPAQQAQQLTVATGPPGQSTAAATIRPGWPWDQHAEHFTGW